MPSGYRAALTQPERVLRWLDPRDLNVETLPVNGADAIDVERMGGAVTADPTVPLGVYVHVPYCARRCGYCAFNTYSLGDEDRREVLERYVEDACGEIAVASAALARGRAPLTSVYFGGGTPTMLHDDQFERLLRCVTHHFDTAEDLEVTVEANPDGLRPEQLDALRAAGATRVSFGMQSTSARVLRVLDRTHDPDLALAAVDRARAAGFEHVSLDLIHGAPGETAADWDATLDAVIATAVDHVSAYALSVEPGTKLAARVRGGALPAPDPDEAADRYLAAEARLTAAGFGWYEISNWARSADGRCRHNELYWRNHDWWGVGPGAHSHIGARRWWNESRPDTWGDLVRRSAVPAAGHEDLDESQRRLETVMLGIRLAEGLPVSSIERPEQLPMLVEQGLVVVEGDRVRLTVDGRLLCDHAVRALTI